MADRQGFANFLGVSVSRIDQDVEQIAHPKERLLSLAASARKELRSDLLPRKGARSGQGLGYNLRLCEFVQKHWNVGRAIANADSLARAVRDIARLEQLSHQDT